MEIDGTHSNDHQEQPHNVDPRANMLGIWLEEIAAKGINLKSKVAFGSSLGLHDAQKCCDYGIIWQQSCLNATRVVC